MGAPAHTLALALWLLATDGGQPLAPSLLRAPVEITSKKLDIYGHENRAVYSGNARVRRDGAVITCDRLTVHYRASPQQVDRIEAEGNVEAVDRERRAKGERADFDNATGVLVLTGNPEAQQGGTRVTGSKVTFAIGREVVDVDDAKTVIDDEPGAGRLARVKIDADHLQIRQAERQAVWSGRVKAVRGPTTVTAPRMVAHYTAEQELERVVGVGGVTVREADRVARGQRADFDNARGLLVMTGNPELRQGPNQLKGRKIALALGTDRVEVDGAEAVIYPDHLPQADGGVR